MNSTMCRQVSDQMTADAAMAVLRTKYWKFVTVRGLGVLAQSIGAVIGQPLRLDRHNETPGYGKVMLDSRELDLLAEITREDRKLFEMVEEAEQEELQAFHREETREAISALMRLAEGRTPVS